MSQLASLLEGFALISGPFVLAMIFLGVLIGLIVGAMPGVGPVPGIAIVLPLTLELDQWEALTLLFAVYVGSMYGGAVSAILLNIPGTPGAIASTFDGYPMSLRGEAKKAIQTSVISSSVGTVLAAVLLIVSVPIILSLVALVGTPEYALFAIFGLTIIPLVSQYSMSKALMMGAFGVLISTVGRPPMSSIPRFNLGTLQLTDGVTFVAVILGIFAISEMLKLVPYEGCLANSQGGGRQKAADPDGSYFNIKEIKDRWSDIFIRNPLTFLKSVIIAIFIGFIPAAGGAVSNILAYATEKSTAANNANFGKGDIRGVISAESANSGTIASTFVPLLAFAIPGSPTSAVILGGMLMHGLVPGPGMFQGSVHVSYATFLSVGIGGIFLLFIGLLTAKHLSQVAYLDMKLTVPPVIILCMIGTYALSLSMLDVMTAIIFGVLGYMMIKYNYSIISFILGLILGPIIENNVFRSLELGDVGIFVGAPLRILLIVLIVGSLLLPTITTIKNRNSNT
ncbi:MAG: tripartite tricarboxylate transporter permease [Natronomonas sp.]